MGRDGKRAKGRDAKGRGGGRGHSNSKMYIDNIEELQMRESRKPGEEGDDDDDEEDDDEEEQGGAKKAEKPVAAPVERKPKAAPAPGGDDDDEEEDGHGAKNPNHVPVAVDPNNPEAGLSRKQREALAAQKAKEDYQRRHMAGETERAREELARLAIVRARREATAKQREAEGRAPGMSANGIDSDGDDDGKPAAPAAAPASDSIAAKKRAAAAAPAEEEPEKEADGGPAKLKSMDIKKMNGDQLKEHCKERGISIQGQKKELMQRLLDHEAARK